MKKFFIISVVAMVLTACSQDTTNDYSIPEMRVGFDDETRVQLNEECKTVWNRGDMVSVFNKTDANSCWRYRGADLARSGAISLVSSPSTYTVTFADVYGVYPYNANYSINMLGEISLSIPAEQNWKDGSYGVGDNIMVAIGEDENLSFKNIFGWLKLQFTGSDAISKITFRGNNNEPLTGAITYDPYYMEAVFSEGAGKEITLICPEVALEADKVQTFYIAIAPQTFTKGVTVEITTSTGEKITKTTDKKLVIERNAIQPMATLDAVIETPDTPDTPTQPTPPNNEIWYTSSDGNVVTPSESDVFGANIVSNTYENGKGVITFDAPITLIGYQAFYNCTSLTSVTIPDSVTKIGYGAFVNCSSLTSVTIPDSVTEVGEYAFQYCTSLASITIPDSVTEIGWSVFCDCTSLTSVTIPDSVTSIESGTFRKCTSLTSVTIPDSVASIGYEAFAYCTSLTSVTIPDSVTEIGKYAFRDCTSLTSVTIPNSVTEIGKWAFGVCDSLTAFYGKFASADNRCLVVNGVLNSFAPAGLTEYAIPDSVTEIGYEAFAYCTSLASVTIPDSVTEIGDEAFRYCTSLTSITIPDRVTSIRYTAFYNCTSLTSVTIGDSVTEIGYGAFAYCTSLTSVTIPDSVTSIGYSAFGDCISLKAFYGKYASADNRCLIIDGVLNSFAPAGLTEYAIPDSVTSIGNSVFFGCTSLTSVTIGDSVTEIGYGAFGNCTSLKEVYCKPTTPPSGGALMFSYYSNGFRPIGCKIYVPRASVDAYKAASNWSGYKSYIEPYDFE